MGRMSDTEMNKLKAATEAHAAARKAADEALKALHAAIADAARSGEKQRDIVEVTGLTRERVRQISRDAGVGPA
jgi:hypothetical protein